MVKANIPLKTEVITKVNGKTVCNQEWENTVKVLILSKVNGNKESF